jgi:hypothetical protein
MVCFTVFEKEHTSMITNYLHIIFQVSAYWLRYWY